MIWFKAYKAADCIGGHFVFSSPRRKQGSQTLNSLAYAAGC